MSKSIHTGYNTSINTIFAIKTSGAYSGESHTKKPVAVNTQYNLHSFVKKFGTNQMFVSGPDGTASAIRQNQSDFTSDYTILLLASNINGTPSIGKGKIKRTKIYEKGVPIHDYLPSLDGNNVPCMWDNIAGGYVYNSGTGTFGYGSALATPPDALEDVLYVKRNGAWEVVQ